MVFSAENLVDKKLCPQRGKEVRLFRCGSGHRNELALSQDALAEILLSEVFQTSLDDLIKGDVEVMKEQVRSDKKTKGLRVNGK